jgi:hypothetical protein
MWHFKEVKISERASTVFILWWPRHRKQTANLQQCIPTPRTDCPRAIRELQWSSRSIIFILLEHVTRGALLFPISGASREVFYLVDYIDEDNMFLRV